MQPCLSLVSNPAGHPHTINSHTHTTNTPPIAPLHPPRQRALSYWAQSYPNGIATVEVTQ